MFGSLIAPAAVQWIPQVGLLGPDGRFSPDPERPACCAPSALPRRHFQPSLGTPVLSCKRAGPGSNLALKIGATEQLRAGKTDVPAGQRLSVHIKICKAEAPAQPPSPLRLVRNWCQLFDCDNCYCLGKWLPRAMGQSSVCRRLGRHLAPRRVPETPRPPASSAYCSQRPAGLGLWWDSALPISLPGKEKREGGRPILLPQPTQTTSPPGGRKNRQA